MCGYRRGWIVAAAVGVALLAGCGEAPTQPDGGRSGVAVLPFEVEGQESGADEVGAAFARSLAIGLEQVPELEVADGTAATDRATRRLTGTLHREGRAVRVSVRLVDAGSRDPAWTVELRADSGDLSALASKLAGETIRFLGLSFPDLYDYIGNVTGGPEMSGSPLAERAWDSRRRNDIEEFLETSSKLTELYADDPAAHVLHAWALTRAWDADPSAETLAQLRERLDTLHDLDPTSPYDELLRAYVYRSSGAPDHARALYSQVLSRRDLTNTARAWALRQRSLAGQQVGDADAARRDAEKAMALDPSNALSLVVLSRSLEALGQLDGAIRVSKQALVLEPFEWRQHQRLGLVFSRAGRWAEAVESLGEACRLGQVQEACANVAVALHQWGRRDQAREAAEYAATLVDTAWGHYNLACYRARAGQSGAAVDDLARALDLGFADSLITTDPDLDSLRGDAGFERLVRTVEDRLRSRREQSGSIFPWQASLLREPTRIPG
jgi:tetratricopeptide (TPR) repeat protein